MAPIAMDSAHYVVLGWGQISSIDDSMQSALKARTKSNNQQPLQAAQLQDALLTIKTVMGITGLSRSSVYSRMDLGTFPRPIKLSKRCVRWTSRSIQDWINAVAKAAG